MYIIGDVSLFRKEGRGGPFDSKLFRLSFIGNEDIIWERNDTNRIILSLCRYNITSCLRYVNLSQARREHVKI